MVMWTKFKRYILLNKLEIAIFLFWLCVFVLTSSHSVVQGDTGDFLSTAATGGIPHDPGYPLYSLIARIVYLLPFGNHAWHVNLISALFGAGALFFLFKTVKLITKSDFASFFAVVALATYPSFWFYSLVAQIHVFQVFLVGVMFFLLLKFLETKKSKYLYFSAFVLGLCVTNSHTVIFTAPGFLVGLYFAKKNLSLKILFISGVVAILGLLPYLYLFWAASKNPIFNWGGIHDLGSFLFIFFRRNYGTFNWSRPEPWLPFAYSPFVHYFLSLLNTSWYIVPFAVIPFFVKRQKGMYSMLFGSALLSIGPMFYLFMNVPLRSIIHVANTEQYLSYPYYFLCVLAGIGFYSASHYFKNINKTLLFLVVVLFFVLPFVSTFSKVRQDNNTLTAFTTKFQLSELPKNSIFITFGDSPYLPLMYWQYSEGYRPDVAVVAYGLLGEAWYRNNLKRQHPKLGNLFANALPDYKALCREYAATGRLYFSPWYPEFNTYFEGKCTLVPYGLVAKVVPIKNIPTVAQTLAFYNSEWDRFVSQFPNLNSFNNGYSRTQETVFRLAEQFNYLGIYLLDNRQNDLAFDAFVKARKVSPFEVNSIIGESAILFGKQKYEDAIVILKDGIKKEPSSVQLYKNLAVIYQKTGDIEHAYEYYKQYISFNPDTDPDVIGIKGFIQSYEVSSLVH